MHKNLERKERLPGQAQYEEMRKDLSFKQRQTDDAEMTAAKLAVEKENRMADLEKIRTLETRIDKEMETV